MNNKKIEYTEFDTYNNIININLFNKLIAFIKNTSNNGEKRNVLDAIKNNCIWYKDEYKTDLQTEYQFAYLGELLERYKERVGENIVDLRAIALALGYCKDIIEDSMIIGTQLIDFINKIKSISDNDIYFKSALYLLENNNSRYGEELLNKQYSKTEEIIFIMSVFNDRTEEIFNKKKDEIIKLLGNGKTISVIGNIGLYGWIIKKLYPLIINNRKKDISILKALISIPIGLQKEESTTYKELIKNNYSMEEIAYLNYLILYYRPVPKTTHLGNSLVEEKIAVKFCQIFINSNKTHSEDTYKLILDVISKYNKFDIKCYGYSSINDLLKDTVNITNPSTFIALYETLGRTIYSFNILEDKWDIVAEKFEAKQYLELFDNFLLSYKFDKESTLRNIEKYNKLTNKNYLESFSIYYYARARIFALLIDTDVINIIDFFKNYKEIDTANYYLQEYIKRVENRKSFELLKYLLCLNTYTLEEINSFGFSLSELCSYYSRWNKTLDIKRDFLNKEEQKLLFDCLENFVFKYSSENYLKFLEIVLGDNDIDEILPKNDLREIYLLLSKFEKDIFDNSCLQQKYLTSEEINNIKEQKRLEAEKEKLEEELNTRKEITEEFEVYEKNNLKNLFEFCDKHKYSFRDKKDVLSIEIVKKYILENIANYNKNNENVQYLIKILNYFMNEGRITTQEFIRIIFEYLKEEVIEYGINTRTY